VARVLESQGFEYLAMDLDPFRGGSEERPLTNREPLAARGVTVLFGGFGARIPLIDLFRTNAASLNNPGISVRNFSTFAGPVSRRSDP